MRISVPSPRRLDDGQRAAEPLDDVLRDRQPEAGARAPRGEVRIEDVRHVFRRDADAGILDDDRDAAAVRPASGRWTGGSSAMATVECPVSGRAHREHRMPRVGQHVDERGAQPLGVGHDRRHGGIEVEGHGGRRVAGPGRLGRRAADLVEIGFRQLEPDRPARSRAPP